MGGATSAQGTVGACFQNKWGHVCDTYWTAADAKVVCGQLGYTGNENGVITTLIFIIIIIKEYVFIQIILIFMLFSGGQALTGSYYWSGYTSVTWSDVGGCTGSENVISACSGSTPVITCSSYAGASCYSEPTILVSTKCAVV